FSIPMRKSDFIKLLKINVFTVVRAAPGFVEDASALIERTAVVLLANSYNAPLISPDIEARA
ncbi:hypothetical protein, partial [Pseudomonas aeruginosa]|uniref:hypothetical protein n=1 Tax=Pseudomonas aeruginosa TaxID=287 RepID=UPI001C130521